MTCTRCAHHDAISTNRLGFCAACEAWRQRLLTRFTPQTREP